MDHITSDFHNVLQSTSKCWCMWKFRLCMVIFVHHTLPLSVSLSLSIPLRSLPTCIWYFLNKQVLSYPFLQKTALKQESWEGFHWNSHQFVMIAILWFSIFQIYITKKEWIIVNYCNIVWTISNFRFLVQHNVSCWKTNCNQIITCQINVYLIYEIININTWTQKQKCYILFVIQPKVFQVLNIFVQTEDHCMMMTYYGESQLHQCLLCCIG